MQGPIAQVAALAIHGNEFLRGRDVHAFWPSATVFRFCRQVTFVTLSGDYAKDPLQWFARLRSEGVAGLRVHHAPQNDPRISDRMSVGLVGGGGRWLIEAVKPAVSDAWEARWEVGDQHDSEQRIWRVTYGRTVTNHAHVEPKQVGFEQLRSALTAALTDIAEFADEQHLEEFGKSFRAGLEVLAAENPLSRVYHSDLAPPHALPLPGQQLLGAAQAAWVFGGMGSWNDLRFEGREQERYEELSDRLFVLLIQAVVEAVNASFGGTMPPAGAEPWWKFWSRRTT